MKSIYTTSIWQNVVYHKHFADIKDALPLVCSLLNETDNFFKMTLLLFANCSQYHPVVIYHKLLIFIWKHSIIIRKKEKQPFHAEGKKWSMFLDPKCSPRIHYAVESYTRSWCVNMDLIPFGSTEMIKINIQLQILDDQKLP